MARVRRVAGVVFHDNDLLDVAGDDRARLGDPARDNYAHESGDSLWGWRGVAWVRRPLSTAVWRRKSEEIVLESGEALHRVGRCSPAHLIDIRPLTAPPCDVVADPGFQVTDDEGRALSGRKGEDYNRLGCRRWPVKAVAAETGHHRVGAHRLIDGNGTARGAHGIRCPRSRLGRGSAAQGEC